jgi:ketosteroid isomerase-like protein
MRTLVAILAILSVAACAELRPGYTDVELQGLFDAERAFARDAVAVGARPAFIAHFDADAVLLAPAPMRYADYVKAHPAPADPRAVLLEWAPQAGAISHAGDLGFTTGPTRISRRNDPKADTTYGYYLSVWSRDRGEWKVVVDAGVTQSAPPPQGDLANVMTPSPAWMFPSQRPPEAPLSPAARDAQRDALFALERSVHAFADAPGMITLQTYATASTIVLRNAAPIQNGGLLSGYPPGAMAATRVDWDPAAGAVAASGDLAYTYGALRLHEGGAAPADAYYVHVWQRDSRGDWKLAAEVMLPAS